MAEEIHTHGDSGGGMGFLVGAILILAAVFLFIVYGLPYLRQSTAPQIGIPGQIDVNVQEGQGGGPK